MRELRARLREAARGGEDRVDQHARHQRPRASEPIGDRRRRRCRRPRRRAASTEPRSPAVLCVSRRSGSCIDGAARGVQHDVERVEHPPERRGDERAARRRACPRSPPAEAMADRCRPWRMTRDHADATARTVMPSRSSPARMRARELVRAGRVAVHAHRVDVAAASRLPSVATTVPSRDHADGARDDLVGIVDHRAGLAPRRQRSVRLVGAIGKPFGGDAQARRPGRLKISEPGRPNRIERRSNGRDGAGDRVGQRGVAHRHVVERAVRLHVLQRDALGAPPSPQARRSGRARSPRLPAASRSSRGARSRRDRESPGCAPTATPCVAARRIVSRITAGIAAHETRRRCWPT